MIEALLILNSVLLIMLVLNLSNSKPCEREDKKLRKEIMRKLNKANEQIKGIIK